MEEAGIPWEASEFLLQMWRAIVTGELIYWYREPPTMRQMVWFWRVHLAAPELKPKFPTGNGILVLAQQFLQRELRHELLAEPLIIEDLTAYLACTPWRSPEHRFAYEEGVANRHILALRGQSIEGLGEVPGIPHEDSEGRNPATDQTSFLAWAVQQVTKEGVI